jgi:hypothetical protein
MSVDQLSVGQKSADQTPVELLVVLTNVYVSKMSVCQMFVRLISVSKMFLGQMSLKEMSVGQVSRSTKCLLAKCPLVHYL